MRQGPLEDKVGPLEDKVGPLEDSYEEYLMECGLTTLETKRLK